MPTFHLNKLVRTKLPKIYKGLGEKAEITELSGEALQQALVTKLAEEVGELSSSSGASLNELADVLQIVHDTAVAAGSSPEALEVIRQKREDDRGSMIFQDNGLTKGYFIGTLECAEDDTWTAYYRNEPERFPEESDKPAHNDISPQPVLQLGRYRHYKGGEYEVLHLACDEATHEWLVIYKPLYDTKGAPEIWVRTYRNFVETVVVDGNTVQRFTPL